jgi:hypothetical protein
MKKPLLVILIIGLVPILLLIIGLVTCKRNENIPTDNSTQTDNIFLDINESQQRTLEFFALAGKDDSVVNLFKDQTIDQLRYVNFFKTTLAVALQNIKDIKLISIEPFGKEGWTAQDNMYLVSYQLTLTNQTYTFVGSNGTNEKIFLLSNVNNEWKIVDILDAPSS